MRTRLTTHPWVSVVNHAPRDTPKTLFASGTLLWVFSVWLLVPFSLLPAASGVHAPGFALSGALLFVLSAGLGARARFRLRPPGPGLALERAAFALSSTLFVSLAIALEQRNDFLETSLGASLGGALLIACGLLGWECLSALARRYGRPLLGASFILVLGCFYALNALAQLVTGAPIIGA